MDATSQPLFQTIDVLGNSFSTVSFFPSTDINEDIPSMKNNIGYCDPQWHCLLKYWFGYTPRHWMEANYT